MIHTGASVANHPGEFSGVSTAPPGTTPTGVTGGSASSSSSSGAAAVPTGFVDVAVLGSGFAAAALGVIAFAL